MLEYITGVMIRIYIVKNYTDVTAPIYTRNIKNNKRNETRVKELGSSRPGKPRQYLH